MAERKVIPTLAHTPPAKGRGGQPAPPPAPSEPDPYAGLPTEEQARTEFERNKRLVESGETYAGTKPVHHRRPR